MTESKATLVLHKSWADMTDAEKDAALEAMAAKLYGTGEAPHADLG